MQIKIFSAKDALLAEGVLDNSFTIEPSVLRKAGGTFTARLSVPIRDIAGYFHPGTTNGPVAKLDWSIAFDGHSSRNFPALCFFSQSGENRFTIFFDDLVDDFTCSAKMNQATASYDIEWTFAVPPRPSAVTMYLDTRGGHWTRAFARVMRALRPNGLPKFPKDAFKPVYCTWYAAHAWLTNDFLDENARLAAELGCGTFIVDDGWCYDELKRVTPETIGPWYDDIGDWELSTKKLPDFRSHVRKAQALGLRYLLWVAPYFCFKNSRFYQSLPPAKRDIACSYGTFVYDVTDKRLNRSVLGRMRRIVRDLGLDGLKVDFLDIIQGNPDKPIGRHSAEFIRKLAEAIREEAGPDALIEFRQRYATPQMLDYATQFRAGDAPFDYLVNLARLAAIRVLLGAGVPIHADPLYWAKDEGDVTVARHMIASLSAVPMLSMDLRELPEAHRRIVAHYLEFYRAHLDVFSKGRWEMRFAGSQPTWMSVTRGKTRIVILVDAFHLDEAIDGFTGNCHLLNLSDRPVQCREAFNACGEAVANGFIPCGGRGLSSASLLRGRVPSLSR